MFDLNKFLTTSLIDVNATDITFKDMRTGQTMKRTIYRPGNTISFQKLGEEMGRYGYLLLAIGDPGNLPGRMNWSEVFGKFIQSEAEEE